MPLNRHAEEYLQRANSAEAWAMMVPDPILKDEWLKTAQRYRDLAQDCYRNGDCPVLREV
jgi:hypothetical protein